MNKNTTHFPIVHESTDEIELDKITKSDENPPNFITQNSNAKSNRPGELVKIIERYVHKHKLTYSDMRYVIRRVNQKCELKPQRDKKTVIDLPTQQEVEAFFSVIENSQHRLMFLTLQGLGLRVSELCNLELKQIDWATNMVQIKNGKGGKDRIVLIGNLLKEKLKIYLHGKTNKYLFETRGFKKYSTRRVQQICSYYLKASGVSKKLSCHTWRHVHMTNLAIHGVSEEKRAILAGHASTDIQKVYTHLQVASFSREIIEILDSPKTTF